MDRWGLSEGEYAALEDEVCGLLSRLLQADTSNPPGDVRPAVRVLQEYFAAAGLAPVVVGEVPERPNVTLRLDGCGDGPSLLFLGHTDVVPAADAGEWTEPPFSGRVKDGYVWGRGALDMKNTVAAEAVALARLARRAQAGERLRGHLVFAATADEETGEYCGAKWLTTHHPDLIRADYVINEGGHEMPGAGESRLYTVHAGEKGYACLRLTARGRGGHGSLPQHRGSVAHVVARIVQALEEYDPEVLTTRTPTEVIDQVAADEALRRRLKDPLTARDALRELAVIDPAGAQLIEPQLGLTFATTNVTIGDGAVNVIPSFGEIVVDCRVLPGQTPDDVRREVERALSGVHADWELDCFCFHGANQSPRRSPLRDAIEGVMSELVPGCAVICDHYSGFTDCTHMRSAFPASICYGFVPFLQEDGADVSVRLHSRDERIAVRDLVLQTVFLERLAQSVLA